MLEAEAKLWIKVIVLMMMKMIIIIYKSILYYIYIGLRCKYCAAITLKEKFLSVAKGMHARVNRGTERTSQSRYGKELRTPLFS